MPKGVVELLQPPRIAGRTQDIAPAEDLHPFNPRGARGVMERVNQSQAGCTFTPRATRGALVKS